MKKISLILFLFFIYFGSMKNITIAIIGTNDIHGAALPTQMVRSDTDEKYQYGGLPIMGGLINIIKNQYPGKVIYLDAGDQFQGGIESSKLISSGKIMNDFYGIMEINGSAIGNHEFDFGPSFLFPFMSGKDAPNLAANLKSEKGESDFLPKQKSSVMYAFQGGIKIGVIGLATTQTPTTTAGFSSGKFPKYKFLQYKDVVIEESRKLRKNGANAVLIVSHVGNGCLVDFKYGIWTKDTKQTGCPDDDEISVLIDSLPEGTIDGIVQGHRHKIVHHFRKGIPYMGNINGGYYFNVMYLTFSSSKEVVNATIEGPIPVCAKVFQNIGRCPFLSKEELKTAGNLKNWRFHNHEVIPDQRVQTVYEQEWLPLMQPYLVDLLSNQVLLQPEDEKQSDLANLINNCIKANFTDIDFSVLNPGGFRTQWVPGILEEKDLYNMFPFDNMLQSFNISGSELLEMLDALQSGQKGFYQFYGIQTTVTFENDKKKFVSAKMMDGSEIDENKYYIGLATDFLLQGGDDFDKVIGIIYTPRNLQDRGQFRGSIRQPLIDLKVIEPNTLIDPNHPRIIVI